LSSFPFLISSAVFTHLLSLTIFNVTANVTAILINHVFVLK
jgi:hypothetical protein